MIQDLGDMNDEDKLAGFRLCYLRTRSCRMPEGGDPAWAPLRGCPAPRASPAPAAQRQPPKDGGRRGASRTATAQRDISGLTATSCGSSK